MATKDIPPELVELIAGHLAFADILILRRTCQKFNAISLRVLRLKGQRLYLHATRLQEAVHICNHQELSEVISEIVVVGRLPPDTLPSAQLFTAAGRLNNHPWPHGIPRDKSDTSVWYHDPDQDSQSTFKEVYQPLLDGLRKLPNLKSITYSATAAKPGFCPVSSALINTHDDDHEDWRTSFGRSRLRQPPDSWVSSTLRWSDLEFMAGILVFNSRIFTNLVLEQPLPCCENPRWAALNGHPNTTSGSRRDRASKAHSFISIGRNIVQCSIRLPYPCIDEFWDLCRDLLRSMPALQDLELQVASDVDKNWSWEVAKDGGEISDSIDDLQFSSMIGDPGKATGLKKLTIRGLSYHPHGLHADGPLALFRSHKDSLKSVKLSNAFFAEWREIDCYDTATVMRMMLQIMQGELGLESVEISLPRLGCDTTCDFKTSGQHIGQCQHYRSGNHRGLRWNGVEVFDNSSQELGVELDENGWWDFGKSVNLTGQ